MRVADIMTTDPTTVRTDTPITEAIALMETHRISGLPVLDPNGCLTGILTEGDLLRRAEIGTTGQPRAGWLTILLGTGGCAAKYVLTHSRRVEDVMTPNVVTVTADTPIEDVVVLMEQRHIKRLPVMRDREIVGIVSRADLVRALGRALNERVIACDSDEEIRERLMSELQAQNWFPASVVRVTVENGAVCLDGTITDERTRTALHVAAQNVAGVVAVEDRVVWLDPIVADVTV